MSSPVSLTSLFQSIGLLGGFALPLFILLIFLLLTLPAVFRPSDRAESIYRSAYAVLTQMLGVLLMTAGGLPALYAVFASAPLHATTYAGLLIVFLLGGILFLWGDNQLRLIDPASKAIPTALFFTAWKFVGLLIVVATLLSLILRLLSPEPRAEDFWIVHMIMLLYGLIISWFTLYKPLDDAPAPPVAIIPKKPISTAKPTAKPSMKKKK
jgi:hypothetical protein